MLTSKDRLALMVGDLQGPTPKHCLSAVEVLAEVARELQRQGYRYRDDFTWPYHVLVLTDRPGRFLSLYCGGFRKDIDIQQLKADGTADTRFKEARFRTPEGAVNYLRRRLK